MYTSIISREKLRARAHSFKDYNMRVNFKEKWRTNTDACAVIETLINTKT